MLISYEPVGDVLTITLQAGPQAQTQVQGTVTVGFDAAGQMTSVSIPEASTVLWEHGGQISVVTPPVITTVVERTILT